MAFYFIFPEKDATLYSHPERTRMNTGADELLEIVKEKGTGKLYYPSRAVIKFKNEDILSVVNDKITPAVFTNGTSQACLQLSTFEHKNLANVLNLEVFAISQSWDEGTGRYSNLPTGSMVVLGNLEIMIQTNHFGYLQVYIVEVIQVV